jgi:hypothetical protein
MGRQLSSMHPLYDALLNQYPNVDLKEFI